MHPIERLRYVARAGAVDQAVLVRETAGAFASLGFDPAGLVTSCRRVLARHPTAGALWTLSAHVLTATDPMQAGWEFADLVADDPTVSELVAAIPDDATVTAIGWPDVVSGALPRRGDLEVLVLDAYGEGAGLVRQLEARDVDAVEVPLTGLGAAAAHSDVVLLEAAATGPDGCLMPAGSFAAAASGRAAGRQVWAVVPAGRALPRSAWEALRGVDVDDEPWEADDEVVPLDLFDATVGPDGIAPADTLRARVDGPVAAELLKAAI